MPNNEGIPPPSIYSSPSQLPENTPFQNFVIQIATIASMKALILILPLLYSCIQSSPSTSTGATVTPDADTTKWSNTPVSQTFIYRANSSLNSISIGSIDTTSGEITENHTVSTGAGTNPSALAFHPSNDFMYVANADAGTISRYTVDQVSGLITKVSDTSTYPGPSKMAIHPSGLYLYTLHSNNAQISTHGINPSTGALTFLSGLTVGGVGAKGLTLDRTGTVLIANSNSWMATYTVNTGTGALTYSGFQTANIYSDLIPHPTLDEFYAPSSMYNQIWGYDINTTDATITANSTSSSQAGFPATTMALDQTGSFAYLATGYPNTIEAYSIGGNSYLNYLNSVSTPTGCNPSSIRLSDDEKFLFVSCSDSSGKTITYSVNSNGTLGNKVWTSKISGAGIKQSIIKTF